MNIRESLVFIINYLLLKDFGIANIIPTENRDVAMQTGDDKIATRPYQEANNDTNYKLYHNNQTLDATIGSTIAYGYYYNNETSKEVNNKQLENDDTMKKYNDKLENRSAGENGNKTGKNAQPVFVTPINPQIDSSKNDNKTVVITERHFQKNFDDTKFNSYEENVMDETKIPHQNLHEMRECICKDKNLCLDKSKDCKSRKCCDKFNFLIDTIVQNIFENVVDNNLGSEFNNSNNDSSLNKRQEGNQIEKLSRTRREDGIHKSRKYGSNNYRKQKKTFQNNKPISASDIQRINSFTQPYINPRWVPVATDISQSVKFANEEYSKQVFHNVENQNFVRRAVYFINTAVKRLFQVPLPEIYKNCARSNSMDDFNKNVFFLSNLNGTKSLEMIKYIYLDPKHSRLRREISNLLTQCFLKYGMCCKKALLVYQEGTLLAVGDGIIDMFCLNDADQQNMHTEIAPDRKSFCNMIDFESYCLNKLARLLKAHDLYDGLFEYYKIVREHKQCISNRYAEESYYNYLDKKLIKKELIPPNYNE